MEDYYKKVFVIVNETEIPYIMPENDFSHEWNFNEIEDILQPFIVREYKSNLLGKASASIPLYSFLIGYDADNNVITVPTYKTRDYCTKVYAVGWNTPVIMNNFNRIGFAASTMTGIVAPTTERSHVNDYPDISGPHELDEEVLRIFRIMYPLTFCVPEVSWRMSLVFDENASILSSTNAAIVVLACVDYHVTGRSPEFEIIDRSVIDDSLRLPPPFTPKNEIELLGDPVDFFSYKCPTLPFFAEALQTLVVE